MKYWHKRLMSYLKSVDLRSKHRLLNIKVDGSSELVRYESLNNDPNIIFLKSLPKGWYVVEIQIHSRVPLNTKLYIGEKLEFSENSSVQLAVKAGKLYKHFIYVEPSLGKLRLDPIESQGDFEIEHFKVQAVTEGFALKRMESSLLSAGKPRINRHDYFNHNGYISAVYDAYNHCKNEKRDQGDSYQQWLEKETTECKQYNDYVKPLISVVIPIYKPNIDLLKKAIASILEQSYKNFEICLADDASSAPDLYDYLAQLKQTHSSVKVSFRPSNGHISAATNSALALAKGDYVVFMDQDDLLAKDALKWLAYEVSSNDDVLLLYSDEDKIDINGNRYEPHFKPKFSPNLLLGQNYISHFTAMKKALVDELGGLRLGYEGAQDHDLLIRALPYLNEHNVIRIPKVLYHWRAIEGSTASAPEAKGYTNMAAVKAVQDYLDQYQNGAIAIKGRGSNTVKIQYSLSFKPFVSLLIPTRDGLKVLQPCIESILNETHYTNFEILILDNDSQEVETHTFFDEIKNKDSRVKVIPCPGEFNYSKINNIGAEHVKGDYIALVNNDIEVIDGNWLSEMLPLAMMDDVGCVGAKLLYSNNTIQHGGVILGIGGIAGHSHLHFPAATSGYFERMNLVHEVSAVTAACLLVRTDTYRQVGGLDESLKVAFNDVDFCLKVREIGLKNIFTPYAELYHHESISRGYEDTPEKQKRFNSEIEKMRSKWGELLINDPFYNPNFNLMAEPYHFTIKQ